MSATAIPSAESAVLSVGTLAAAPMHGATARLRRAVEAAGDVLLAMALVMCIPFVILAFGVPIALFVQLVLWIVRLL